MTKYRLLCPIPHTDYEKGHTFEVGSSGTIRFINQTDWYPVTILLMVKAGILEEVKEEESDYNWKLKLLQLLKHYYNDLGDVNDDDIVDFVQKTMEAQAALNKIMEK